MILYRGVEKDAVIRSIRESANFVQGLNIGPITNQQMQDMLAKLPELEAAQTAEAFLQAMKQSQFESTISGVREILMPHAIMNTNGTALGIVRNVMAWRGNEAIISGGYTEQIDYAQKLENSLRYKLKFAAYAARSQIAKKDVLFGDAVADPVEEYGLVHKIADTPVPFDQLGSDWFKNMYEEANPVLAPFTHAGDVKTVGLISFPAGDQHKWCVYFRGTKAAAQALADAFPEREVISGQNERIQPSTQVSDVTSEGRAVNQEKSGRQAG